MKFNNDILAIFKEVKTRGEKSGYDRIDAPRLLQVLVEKKGVLYKLLKVYASDEEIKNIIETEIEEYNDKSVIENFFEEDKEWLKSQGNDLESNPGVNLLLKGANGKEEYLLLTFEVYLMFDYLSQIGIDKITRDIFEVAFIIGYIPQTFVSIMIKLGMTQECIKDEQFIKSLNEREEETFKFVIKCIVKSQGNKEENEKQYDDGNLENNSFIPNSLKYSLQEFDCNNSSRINARANEIDNVWNVMMRSKDNNVVLVGEEKIGKSAIVEKIAYLIKNGECPEKFKHYRVVKWDLNSLFLSSEDAGGRTFDIMQKWLKENRNIILVIDEMPTIVESSKMLSISIILKYAMKVFLEDGDNRIIAIASNEEYKLYFEYTNCMPNNFESVIVKEPKTSEIIPMIKEQVDFLQKTHNVKISNKNIKLIISIAETLSGDKNPGKTLRIIEKSLITAKNLCKEEVEKDDILKNCNISYDTWENLTKENITATAFHEAGHYIVGKMCKHISNIEPNVVSILPAYDFMGVTTFEYTEKSDTRTKEWFIDYVAMLLAGRVAEKMYTGKVSAGASSDIERATSFVEHLILDLGMFRFAPNMVVDYYFCTDWMKWRIYRKTKKIIAKANKRAEEIIYDNLELLLKIVEELQENWILSKEELDELAYKNWQKFK